MLKNIPGIEKVTLTTNGVQLEQYLDQLLDAGLDAVNISLDTVDPVLYEKITGRDKLSEVMKVIEKQKICRSQLRSMQFPLISDSCRQAQKLQDFTSGKLAAGSRACKALSCGCAFYRNDAHWLWQAV